MQVLFSSVSSFHVMLLWLRRFIYFAIPYPGHPRLCQSSHSIYNSQPLLLGDKGTLDAHASRKFTICGDPFQNFWKSVKISYVSSRSLKAKPSLKQHIVRNI